MDGFSAIARILKHEGVEWVACYPSNNLIEEVAQEGIRTVMFRHERGAVMAADGYSRANDRQKFGVVITQGASGAENAMGGIAQAFGDNIPILLIPGGSPLSAWNIRPNFAPSRVYAPICKRTEVILTPDDTGNAMRRAFHALRNGTGGPVTVETPADVMAADAPDAVVENYHSPRRSISVPSRSDVRDAVKLLLNANNPVLWVGGGVLYGGATEELRELAELLDVPVFTTMQGKSAFPETHPLSLGAGSGATTWPARKWLLECDVLFAIGSSLTITGYGQPVPPGKILIQNTDNVDEINKQESVDIGLPGDSKATLEMAIDEVKAAIGETPRNTGVRDRIAAEREKWMEEWTPLLQSDEVPINTYRVIHEINTTLDKSKSVVTHGRGRAQGLDHPILRVHDSTRVRRLGKDDPPGLWHSADDRLQARQPGPLLPQPDGRRRVRNVGHRHRDRSAGGRSDHHGRAQQRRHGHLSGRLPDRADAVRRNRDERRLRGPRRCVRRSGHQSHQARRDEAGTDRRPAAQRRRPDGHHRRTLKLRVEEVPVLAN